METEDRNLAHKIRISKKEVEKSSPHIKWYVEYLYGVINDKDEKIKEYKDFFTKLNTFISDD